MTTTIYFGKNTTKYAFGILKLNTTPVTYKDVNIDYNTLSPANKVIFDTFFTLVTIDASLTITNCPFIYDGNITQYVTIDLLQNTITDYLTMSAVDKIKVDNFGLLLAL